MDYGFWAVVLLAVGTVIVIAEFFIPSGGVLGVFSACCIFASAYCAYKQWYTSDFGFFLTYMMFMAFIIPSSIIGTLYYLPKTSVGKRILLAAPELNEVTPFAEEEERLQRLIGKRGKTLSLLNPGGMAIVDGERLHCFSEGMVIDPDTEIEVVKVSGTRVMVTDHLNELEPEPEDVVDPLAETVAENQDDDQESALDFDIPTT